MKNNLKKLSALSMACMLGLTAAACGSGSAGNASNPASSGNAGSGDQVQIGILQYAPHASLDNCYKGIIEGLEAEGFVNGDTCAIEFVNGNGESETNNMAASTFVNKGYDMIIAIATPSATAAYAAAKDSGIPVIFSAVSDPVAAGLVKTLEAPESGATGTSDGLNYEAQLAMIRAFQPDAKKIGILYTTSEDNSKSQLARYQELAGNYGFEIKGLGITDASEVASGAAALVADGIDCLNNLTDNNVVNNFAMVTAATDAAGIPAYGSEEEQVAKYGCVASETLDYVALGVTTGKMAAQVLKGQDINTLAVSVVTDSEPVYNSENMAKFNLELPADYADARERKTEAAE